MTEAKWFLRILTLAVLLITGMAIHAMQAMGGSASARQPMLISAGRTP